MGTEKPPDKGSQLTGEAEVQPWHNPLCDTWRGGRGGGEQSTHYSFLSRASTQLKAYQGASPSARNGGDGGLEWSCPQELQGLDREAHKWVNRRQQVITPAEKVPEDFLEKTVPVLVKKVTKTRAERETFG